MPSTFKPVQFRTCVPLRSKLQAILATFTARAREYKYKHWRLTDLLEIHANTRITYKGRQGKRPDAKGSGQATLKPDS